MIVLSWTMAFRKTWRNYANLKNMQTELTQAEYSKREVSRLEEKLSAMQQSYGVLADSTDAKLIFKRISDISNNHRGLKIVSFPEIHMQALKKYEVETLQVELEGDYKKLLSFIFDLEKEVSIGKLASLNFKLHKDLRSKKEYLRLKIYIQNSQKLSAVDEKESVL